MSLARPGAVGGKSGTSMGGWWELIFSRLDSSRGGGGHKLRVSLARPGVVGGHKLRVSLACPGVVGGH